MEKKTLPVGKLPHEFLGRMLSTYTEEDPRVIVGPRVGEDATVIDFGDRYLVAKTDPITFATERIGWYALNVNANDIASMGARPKWFLATILLPENATDEASVESIFKDLQQACSQLGVSLCGGHTEITYGLDRPIIIGQLLGEVEPERLVTSSGAKPGDVVLMTKRVCVEGTAILAAEKRSELEGKMSESTLRTAAVLLTDPGISVVKEAMAICDVCKPGAMHDPTEGGLATALRELAIASDVGLRIDGDSIPYYEETRLLCDFFEIEPLGLIASGSLLAVLAPTNVDAVLHALNEAAVETAVIGEVKEPSFGLRIELENQTTDLPVFEADELGKVFSE